MKARCGLHPPCGIFTRLDYSGLRRYWTRRKVTTQSAMPTDDGLSPSPPFGSAQTSLSDRTQGLIQTGGVFRTPHELDITPVSLRRTGRAILMASSATGSAQCKMVSPAPFRSFGNELLRVSCTHIHSASKVLLFRRMSRDPVSREQISARSREGL